MNQAISGDSCSSDVIHAAEVVVNNAKIHNAKQRKGLVI